VVDDVPRLRARGEIGLGLAPGGARPRGWSPDEIKQLVEEIFLVPGTPPDRAWIALARGRPEEAAAALAEAEERRAEALRDWAADRDEGSRRVRLHPAVVLDVEARALRTPLGATRTGYIRRGRRRDRPQAGDGYLIGHRRARDDRERKLHHNVESHLMPDGRVPTDA
jgi:hypothetical protein